MSRVASGDLIVGGEPRVDLLPPEVRAKRRGSSARRLLAMALIAAVVIVGGGYVLASFRASVADGALVAAQSRTQELLEEQLTYAEVTEVVGESQHIVESRAYVTSTEVLWKKYLDPVLAILPPTATVTDAILLGRSPLEPELLAAGPLRKSLVASVTLTVDTPTISDATGWTRKLPDTPAFSDVVLTTVANLTGTFSTTITINIDGDALSHRFDDAGDGTEDGE